MRGSLEQCEIACTANCIVYTGNQIAKIGSGRGDGMGGGDGGLGPVRDVPFPEPVPGPHQLDLLLRYPRYPRSGTLVLPLGTQTRRFNPSREPVGARPSGPLYRPACTASGRDLEAVKTMLQAE